MNTIKSPSLCIKVHYYYISQDELWKKYENIIKKVEQNKTLSDMEALDIAFISKFISQEYAPQIIESLSLTFENAIIEDISLKLDVGVILGGMILKRITNTKKQNRLLWRINMKHIEKEIDKLVYDEYGDILNKKDEEIEAQANEITKLNKTHEKYKNKIKQLNDLKDLTPEAKKIINSMMLL